VSAVDDPAVICRVCVGLRTKFEAKVFDHIGRRAFQRLRNAAEVRDNSFDSVALSFNLGLQALHFVAVEGVGDILFHGMS